MAEITVSDFIGLKNAITDATSTVIYLDNDITFDAGGISVPRAKGDITIDGRGHTVTDRASSASGNTINYSSSSGPDVTFTVKNVIWNGRNFYGIVHAVDSYNCYGITIVLDHVNYTGPQPVHNRWGATRIVDSTFNLIKNGSPNAAQELVETNRLSIGGTVSVTKEAANSVLWFTNSGTSFTVEENAVFSVDAPDTYLFYSDGSMVEMTYKAGSITNISTRNGLYTSAASTLHIASSFTLEAGASFTSVQASRTGIPTFKCRNRLTLEEGSTMYIEARGSSSTALMYFSAQATINFNNPKSVVLYNNGGNVFYFAAGSAASPNTININTELLNFWTSATAFPSAGTFLDTPTRAFQKINGQDIEAHISTSAGSTTAIVDNIEEGDIGAPMDTSTFNIMSAKVISMGRLPLTANDIKDISTVVTGASRENTDIRVSYGTTVVNSATDANGNFSVPIVAPVVGTAVTIASNWKFLIKNIQKNVKGSVTITHLDDLIFNSFTSPARMSTIKRQDPDWYIEITDTRDEGDKWYLYVSLPEPMRYQDHTLDNVLTFNDLTFDYLITDNNTLVRAGSRLYMNQVTVISWDELSGFLLLILPQFEYYPGKYSSELKWIISETPIIQ